MIHEIIDELHRAQRSQHLNWQPQQFVMACNESLAAELAGCSIEDLYLNKLIVDAGDGVVEVWTDGATGK